MSSSATRTYCKINIHNILSSINTPLLKITSLPPLDQVPSTLMTSSWDSQPQTPSLEVNCTRSAHRSKVSGPLCQCVHTSPTDLGCRNRVPKSTFSNTRWGSAPSWAESMVMRVPLMQGKGPAWDFRITRAS